MMYVYLDESGELSFKANDYFSIAAICTKNPKPLNNCIIRTKKKLSKKFKKTNELKFSESSNKVRYKVLKCVSNNDVHISTLVVHKSILDFNYSKPKPMKLGLLKDILFYHVINQVLRDICKEEYATVSVDKYLNKSRSDSFNLDFDNIIKYAQESEDFDCSPKYDIKHKKSYDEKGLQIADFLAGSMRQHAEGNSEYYNIIENRVFHQGIIKLE